MADGVVEFLRHPASPERLTEAGEAAKAAFLPSLVVAASDDPEHLHCILASIDNRWDVARALGYAQLDFDAILRNVDAAAQNLEGQEEDRMDDEVLDECLSFEQANEHDRTEMALVSLLKRSRGKNLKDMGSIWNNAAAYISELSVLLPIAIRRCPTLITAERLIDALLTADGGVQLLVTTLANNPNLVESAAVYLVSFDKSEHESGPDSSVEQKPSAASSSRKSIARVRPELQFAISTLMELCRVAPSFATTCRDVMVTSAGTSVVALLVTVDLIHDELEFLSGVLFKSSQCLLSSISNRRSTLLQRLPAEDKTGGSSKSVQLDSVVLRLRKALLSSARKIKEEKGWCPQMHAHIKVYSVLIRTGELHPINEEVDFWLRTLTLEKNTSPGGPASQRTLELGIVFLCLVPNLTAPNTRPLYHGCVSYLLQSVKSALWTSTMELAVWLSVQLLLRHFSDIAEFVRETVGVHVTVHNASMRDLAESALSSGISDPGSLAHIVASLRPRGALTGNLKSRSLMCLEQLVTSGTFGRWSVDILGAVKHNILRAREPIPQKLVRVIQTSVEAPVHQGNGKSILKVTELQEFLLEAIAPAIHLCGCPRVTSGRSDSLPPAVLACFYVLCREHVLRCTGLEEDEKWWADLLSCIPWRTVLLFMESKSTSYEHLLPQWLALATSLFPEKFMVPDLLDNMEDASSVSLLYGVPGTDDPEWVETPSSLSPGTIKDACSNALEEPLPVLCILQKMRLRSSSYDWDLKEVINNPGYWDPERALLRGLMPALLDSSCPTRIQDFFCKWWITLPDAALDLLIVTFFEAVRTSSTYLGLLKSDSPLSYSALAREPLMFLSCKPQLFRTLLLPIYLGILGRILLVNRRICEFAASDSVKDGGLKREELAVALTVQDSAVCQSLLDRCLENKLLGDGESHRQLSQAQKFVCATITSMCHGNTLLLKLIHFQGYDVQLIPMMLQHVPIMSQCLDFLEELLQQQQVEKQIFSIHVASAVIARYPTASQGFVLAEKVLDHVIEIQASVAGSSGFLQRVTGVMADFAITFPSLTSKVVPFLQSCAQAGAGLTKSGPARDPKLEEAAVCAFKKLVQNNVIHGQLMEPNSNHL